MIDRRRPRLLFVVTVPVTADVLLRGQLAYLRANGFDVHVVSSPGPELERVAAREGVVTHSLPMQREIDAIADGRALLALSRLMRVLRPDIVNASTAKAGLLGMLAATRHRVPVRVYQLRGLRLESERGAKRTILAATERIAAACAHRIICNSESLHARYVELGYAPRAKCAVLGRGSSNGVDIARFERQRWEPAARMVREQLELPAGAPVIGFVGRPVADKGIGQLLAAFRLLRSRVTNAHLVIVGGGFAGDEAAAGLGFDDPGVHFVARVDEPAPYYALMDVLAFPSRREGLPNAVLEAAAMELPVVGSRSTGVIDAVANGQTGILIDTSDSRALAAALERYVTDVELRRVHGRQARERVVREYAQQQVWQRWCGEYRRLLRERPD